MNHHYARRSVRACAMLAVGALAMQACATKGYVRKQVAASNSTLQAEVAVARDSAIRAANQMRETADAGLEQRIYTRVDSQIAALRADLTMLRQEFSTRITMMEDSLKLAMPVSFNFDEATVTEASKPAIQSFASLVKKHYPSSRITIEGFADPAGSSSYNLRLSRERAEAVRNALIDLGVDGSHLMTVGYGESRLINPRAQKDDAGAEQNRRVVFAIETAGAPVTMAMLVGK